MVFEIDCELLNGPQPEKIIKSIGHSKVMIRNIRNHNKSSFSFLKVWIHGGSTMGHVRHETEVSSGMMVRLGQFLQSAFFKSYGP